MRFAALSILILATVAGNTAGAQSGADLASQVREAERAFAGAMARRDFKAFGELIADDAVFFGDRGAQRGKAAVLDGWQPLFNGPAAPFSWEPESVEVLATGTLAHSSGPVKDPAGKQVGVFNSIWRRESNGRWRVVFDKGCNACNCQTGN